ncbi:hypothetical protein, partial [Pectobacterium aroidearum]|uniref:hypothetical protein n=1 Tax=Pectobacterium aroidearum TaxID=1201031 RepID=UPI001C5D57C8
ESRFPLQSFSLSFVYITSFLTVSKIYSLFSVVQPTVGTLSRFLVWRHTPLLYSMNAVSSAFELCLYR